MNLKLLMTIIACLAIKLTIQAQQVLPSKNQVKWAETEIGAMFHLDMQVFEPDYKWRETRDYQPDPLVFNPKELDTDQWIKAAKSAGAKYAVLVAKHGSGFSLWPTEAHDYSVKSSPWRDGKGDIVKDFFASCKKYGLEPGLYCSSTSNAYFKVDHPGLVISGDPEEQQRYNRMVQTQLTELWTRYGNVFEIWFDGGILPPEKGGFDVGSMIKKYQPNALIFGGPYGYENNIRWVGNEKGIAPYPCWATEGKDDGRTWCQAEADFALRKRAFLGGWLWHEGEEDKIRSLDDLMERYVQTVGRNANMLLGIVIDDRGLVPDADMQRLAEFGLEVKKRFSKPLEGTNRRNGNLFTIDFNSPQTVSYVVIQEDIAKGERIREYKLFGNKNGEWKLLRQGSCIGHKRIELIEEEEFLGIKLEIAKSEGNPKIKKIVCF